MTNRAKIDLLREYADLLAGDDVEAEALRWDWASVSQLCEWLERGSCARGDVARALRAAGCTPAMCALEIVTATGDRNPIGLLAAQGKISVREARRRALADSK